jgi:hypothetical protein
LVIDHVLLRLDCRHLIKILGRLSQFIDVAQQLHYEAVLQRRDGYEPLAPRDG